MDSGGYDRLSADAQDYIHRASYIIGPKRHLSMLPEVTAETVTWPIPFTDGITTLLDRRGTPSIMLVSGDPFWFGAGTQITKHLEAGEWCALPGHSCFSLAASHMGWALETTLCLGLHAAPFTRLRPHLAPGQQIMATLRDGEAVPALASYLTEMGFGDTHITCLEALGQSDQRITSCLAHEGPDKAPSHPVMVALSVAGEGPVMPKSSGISDEWFDHDGQITKQPIRAMTLSALAPRPGDVLWDLGAGSGSIAIEWLLSCPSLQAVAVEKHPARAATIRENAVKLGVNRLQIVEADIETALDTLPAPNCVFVGGGLREHSLTLLWDRLPAGTRLVANGVTLETDQLLISAYQRFGGHLMRLEVSQLQAIGTMHGWKAAYPITQWTVTR